MAGGADAYTVITYLAPKIEKISKLEKKFDTFSIAFLDDLKVTDHFYTHNFLRFFCPGPLKIFHDFWVFSKKFLKNQFFQVGFKIRFEGH